MATTVKFKPAAKLKSTEGSKTLLDFDEGDQPVEEFKKDLRRGTKFNFEALRKESETTVSGIDNEERKGKALSSSSSGQSVRIGREARKTTAEERTIDTQHRTTLSRTSSEHIDPTE